VDWDYHNTIYGFLFDIHLTYDGRREQLSGIRQEQVERRRRKNRGAAGAESVGGGVWGGVSPSHWEESGNLLFFGVAKCVFWCILYPFCVLNCCSTVICLDLENAWPVWHSSRTVAQSKALSIIFPGGRLVRDKCNHCQRRNTESRRQRLSQLSDGTSGSWIVGSDSHRRTRANEGSLGRCFQWGPGSEPW